MRRFKRILALGLTAMMLSACGQNTVDESLVVVEHEKEGEGVSYEFAIAEIGNVVKTQKVNCEYRQNKEQRASFQINGKLVDRVLVKQGDYVKKGDVLATLSSRELERKIEDVKYRINRAEIQLKNLEVNELNDIQEAWVQFMAYTRQSAEDNKNTKAKVENIQKNYRYQKEDLTDSLNNDKKNLAQLQGDLSRSKLVAEMDGMVLKMKDNLLYSTSKYGEEIITIMDVSDCFFETKVPNPQELFREGEAVTMNIVYGAAAGEYKLIPHEMDKWGETQVFEILDGPEGSEIEVGTLGTMIAVCESRSDVLCVDARAIHKADDKYYVYVLGADNLREIRWVEAGLVGDEAVEILSGITEGEKVILK